MGSESPTTKDESYWRQRWGQIDWRLARINGERRTMENDIEECRRELIKLGVKP